MSRRGLTVSELRAKVVEEATAKAEAERKARLAAQPASPATQPPSKNSSNAVQNARRDNSPVRPLSSILNLSRIFATPHTAEQVSAIWTAYHTARTGGGYVCASVPLVAYESMMRAAMRYPYFVIPVPRPTSAENSLACEFYVMQWAFYDPPPLPSVANIDSIGNTISGVAQQQHGPSNPRPSTVLFAPLHEYKQRDTYTTPHLVLTHYTDLAQTHGVVLLRCEVTPCNTATDSKAQVSSQAQYLMSQQDAQMLAMGVQRFYLWGQGKNGVECKEERLLKTFHESPEQFNWEELLKYANLVTA